MSFVSSFKFAERKIWCLRSSHHKQASQNRPNYYIFTLLCLRIVSLVHDFSVLSPGGGTNKICFHTEICMFQPFIGGIWNKNPVEIQKFWKFCTWKFANFIGKFWLSYFYIYTVLWDLHLKCNLLMLNTKLISGLHGYLQRENMLFRGPKSSLVHS